MLLFGEPSRLFRSRLQLFRGLFLIAFRRPSLTSLRTCNPSRSSFALRWVVCRRPLREFFQTGLLSFGRGLTSLGKTRFFEALHLPP